MYKITLAKMNDMNTIFTLHNAQCTITRCTNKESRNMEQRNTKRHLDEVKIKKYKMFTTK